MPSKPIHKLTQEECIRYYDALTKNATSKWKIAGTLSRKKEYGAATSHLLISIEESIKSVIVFFDSKGCEFRHVNGADRIFNNHRIRFFLAFLMFGINIFGEDLFKWLKKIKKNPTELHKKVKGLILDKKELPLGVKFYLTRKFYILKKEKEWFQKADILRQIGFYADYNEEIQSPETIDQATYEEIHARLFKIRNLVSKLIKSYNSMSENEIEEMKNEFKKRNIYSLLEQGLAMSKSYKSSPFEMFS